MYCMKSYPSDLYEFLKTTMLEIAVVKEAFYNEITVYLTTYINPVCCQGIKTIFSMDCIMNTCQ